MKKAELKNYLEEIKFLISHNKNSRALKILDLLIHKKITEWEIYWLVAQAQKNCGNTPAVDKACAEVLKQNPEFWFARELPKHTRGYYSQMGQDEIVEQFFKAHPPKNRVFVEVGAFDGVHYSNVRRLQEVHKWSGISIEPVKKNFDKLSKSYEGAPVICVNCAVGEIDGFSELNVSTYPHLPDWGSDVATFSKSETYRWNHKYDAVWSKEYVSVKTLTSILRENHVDAIDFLSIDTEGHDLDVLKGLDFCVYRPQIIIVEYNRDREKIFDFLASRGYLLWLDNGQDLFMVDANTLRISTDHTAVNVINFNGATGNQPDEEIQIAVESKIHALLHIPRTQIKCIVIVGGYLGWELDRIFKEYPNTEIHIFEPSQRYFRPLSERYSKNKQVFCHNFAVSDSNGTAIFQEDSLAENGFPLSIKIEKDNSTYITHGTVAAENYHIRTVRLDDFEPLAGKNIDLLWCDVQGHELCVLKGATNALESCNSVFLKFSMCGRQCVFDDLNTYLATKQFYIRCTGVSNSGSGSGKALWVRAAQNKNTTLANKHIKTIVEFSNIQELLNPHLIALNYLPWKKPIFKSKKDPIELLSCARFDIIPKFFYAKYRELCIDSLWAREIYEAHLRAFNGVSEGDASGKSGINAFTDSFNALLDSIKKVGFDPQRSLVPVDHAGVIIDGGHRLAASLLYRRNLDILEFDINANSYNYEFFLNKGLTPEYCDAIAFEYCNLNPHSYIVTVFPSAVGKEQEIRNILKRHGEVFYDRQVQLSHLGSINLIRQIYAKEHWVGSYANQFKGAQNKAAECFRTKGPVRVYVITSTHFEKVKTIKQEIRDLFGISNHSVHINDTHEETIRLGQLLLNTNSVHFLNNAQLKTFPRFQTHFDNYKKVLQQQRVDGEFLCIDGSSVMAAYGMREARDLDYLHFNYDNLEFDYPPELIGSHNSEIAHHVTTRDDIIFNPNNHFYYDGIKFASLGIIRALKEKRHEPKDVIDVALIDRLVTTTPTPPHIHPTIDPKENERHATGFNEQHKIVGLVPARNEKHTIAQCLKALSLFTDAIVYLDDASTDETPQIVESMAKECRIERIIRKKKWNRDEPGDRNKLLQAGREIGGTHFIVIDADEIITSNLLINNSLKKIIKKLKPGDRLALNWIQLWRSVDQYRFDNSIWTWNYKEVIFCDDKISFYSSEFIHTPRIPNITKGVSHKLEGYKAGLLHFQFVNWNNLLIKQAWYRCLEKITNPEKSIDEINNRYAPSKDEININLKPSDPDWFKYYSFFDFTIYQHDEKWRLKDINDWITKLGKEYFSGLDIWDIKFTNKIQFKESRLAHKLLDGLKGIEIGASAHNPFGLNTRNVGLKINGYIEEQMDLCGKVANIDIVACAHNIPLPDNSEDFIISSHVIEHCPDLIRTLREWFRIIRNDGYLYMIVPHRDASSEDVGRPLTTWAHIYEDYINDVGTTSESDPQYYANHHCHIFTLETMKIFISKIFNHSLHLVAEQNNDDKVGNGFTLVYKKKIDPNDKNKEYFNLLKLNHNEENKYKVTAIVSTYNSEIFIENCLKNLINQTLHKNNELEIIVIDSNSEQNEKKIVNKFQKTSRHIKYVRTDERESIYMSWNRGCKLSKGKYITNANTDDSHRYDALEVMANTLDSHTTVALVYADVFVTRYPNQSFDNHIRCGYHIRPDFETQIMLTGCHMGPQPMWRREIHSKIGWFDETFVSAGDYDFWCKVALHYQMFHIPEFLGLYYENPHGICNSALNISYDETKTIKEKYFDKFPKSNNNYTNNFQFDETIRENGFVNIGIITFNRLEFTKKTIESVIHHTRYPYVITVVDNNSDDGTQQYLKKIKEIGLIKNLILSNKNLGVAKASNLAWNSEPNSEYYLKLDNDIIIQTNNWLHEMVKVADKIPQSGTIAYNFEPTSYPIATINGLKVRPKHNGQNLGGACILIPKRTQKSIGYWSEEYGLYGEEDADYGFRSYLAGLLNIYMENENIGIHLPGGKAAAINLKTYEANDNSELLIHKNYRLFKDKLRRKNMQDGGLFYQNKKKYELGIKKLYINPFDNDHKRKLIISVYPLDKNIDACAHYRILSPFGHLSQHFEILWNENFTPDNMSNFKQNALKADIILIQRFFPCYETSKFIDFLFSLNKPVIYEIDDLLTEIPTENPSHGWSLTRKKHIYDVIRRADAVTVSTAHLKEHFASFNNNIFVLPNYIDTKIWRKKISKNQSSRKLRICYAGTITHKNDIQIITEALHLISKKYYDRVSFIFFGCSNEKLNSLPDSIFIEHEKKYANYSHILQKLNIDIILVPLLENKFNQSKSNIKWLEYSSIGIPGIYSDVTPYSHYIKNNHTGILTQNTTECWYFSISKLIEDNELRKNISFFSFCKVVSEYNIKDHAHEWLDAYKKIFNVHLLSSNIIEKRPVSTPIVDDILPIVSFNISGKRFASQYLRQIAPLLELEKKKLIEIIDGHTLLRRSGSSHSFDTSSLPNKPIIFLQRDFSPYEFLFETDHTLIYDLDDNLLDLPDNHPDSLRYQKLSKLLKKYLHRFTAVIVPTENLRNVCAVFNPNTQVIPNFIPFAPAKIERSEQKARVLISGTRSHLRDVEFLVPVIKSICTEFPDSAEFIFWGYCPDELRHYSNIHFKDTFVDDYPTYLHQLASVQADIGLIPLAFTWFNSFKSNIKWKEYAICNMVSIASNTDPYQTIRHGEDGFLTDNSPQAWKELLIRLINDPQLRASMASAAADRVRSDFMLSDNLHVFEDVLYRLQIRATQVQPEISIIIPVFNKKDLTYNCLQALFGLSSKHQYEVIVIDNASTDGTQELLYNHFPACRIVTNTENMGFASACNQGAHAAKGHYLVFLNNDTVPLPGWLDNLVDALRRHPDAGIVGCKLLYPDETIQHCGASMNHDGTFFRHQYKFLPSSHPLVNSERELDAVTAACFITPRTLFHSLGMFDTGYSNGCEDMDYCSKVKQAKYRIFYTPSSVLYHLESQTQRPKNRDRENFALYLSKWGPGFIKNEIEIYAEDDFWTDDCGIFRQSTNAWLREFTDTLKKAMITKNASIIFRYKNIIDRIYPAQTWIRLINYNKQTHLKRFGLNILFVCHNFPPYNTAGAQLFALELARQLKRDGHNIAFLYPVDISQRKDSENRTPYDIVIGSYEEFRVFQINVDDLNTNLMTNPQHMFANDKVEQRFTELLRQEQFQLVHFHLLYRLSARLPLVAKNMGVPTVATLHDYWLLCAMGHLIDSRSHECTGPESPEKCAHCLLGFNEDPSKALVDFFSLRQKITLAGYNAIDRILSPSRHLAGIHTRFGFPKPEILPLGWPEIAANPKTRRQGDKIIFGFIGQIVYRKGLDLLVNTIRALDPELQNQCEIHIHGSIHQQHYFDSLMDKVRDNPGVKFFGPYKHEDLGKILSSFDVTVIPSRQENYPLTVLESLSAKVPVIASDVGGIREMFQDHVEGFLFKKEDVSRLVKIFRMLIIEPSLLDTMRSKIKPIKSISRNAEEYAHVYQDLIQQKQITPR